ncbi:hypothetical protein HNQ68_003367 [Pseudochrobactrum saccharolyticum]|uniref:Uncharacterized protein n=1 Tax=Pseudochrobactrum saccharolyticum TaxID=354352 RepID=A0A7W8ER02_9HYPH|nr:hypothetical protein [Pseudochrobactrum saccharolyticum]KAB0539852.1 hypothetical protein F7P81_00050 [Pseudochrobactrum saccharolyticum]MBB5092804.1 hypothetical protein [Pseudochrobactrum saccharolyticum]
MQPDLRMDGVTASQLVSGALISALVSALRRKGIFSDNEITEIYTEALTLLEIDQSPQLDFKRASDMAIGMLRTQLNVPENEN